MLDLVKALERNNNIKWNWNILKFCATKEGSSMQSILVYWSVQCVLTVYTSNLPKVARMWSVLQLLVNRDNPSSSVMTLPALGMHTWKNADPELRHSVCNFVKLLDSNPVEEVRTRWGWDLNLKCGLKWTMCHLLPAIFNLLPRQPSVITITL